MRAAADQGNAAAALDLGPMLALEGEEEGPAPVLADFVCSVEPGAADGVGFDGGDHVVEGEAGWQGDGLVPGCRGEQGKVGEPADKCPRIQAPGLSRQSCSQRFW
jgi:hypothetical protein